MIKEFKENKYTMIVFLLFFGMFIMGWLVYGVVMPSKGAPVYGNRLEGIEKVEIKKQTLKNIEKNLEEKSIVNNASTHISGKIINVLIEVKDGTKLTSAKVLNTQVTKELSKEELSFYDVQILITNENKDAKGYPIIGYKSAVDKKFTF